MIKVWTDGGGPTKKDRYIACGVYVLGDNNNEITRFGKFNGTGTNNISEYLAAIEAVKWLINQGYENTKCTIYMDSKLIVYQYNNKWVCKKPHLQILLGNLRELTSKFTPKIEFKWVPREQNKVADSEATKILESL